MGVIINDIEIVIESKKDSKPIETPPPQSPVSSPLTPLDIRDILQRQLERQLRIDAY